MPNRVTSAMKELSIKLPLVLLMLLGAGLFAGGIYGHGRPDPASRAAFVFVGLSLLFGPWALMRHLFRGKS